MMDFGFFPKEALANENRVNLRVAFSQLGKHHATVEAATDERADEAIHLA